MNGTANVLQADLWIRLRSWSGCARKFFSFRSSILLKLNLKTSQRYPKPQSSYSKFSIKKTSSDTHFPLNQKSLEHGLRYQITVFNNEFRRLKYSIDESLNWIWTVNEAQYNAHPLFATITARNGHFHFEMTSTASRATSANRADEILSASCVKYWICPCQYAPIVHFICRKCRRNYRPALFI